MSNVQPPDAGAPPGPVPDGNRPGHHPAHEQDKPDLDAFARKLGVVDSEVGDDGVGPGAEPAGRGGRGRLVALVLVALATALGVFGLAAARRRRTTTG